MNRNLYKFLSFSLITSLFAASLVGCGKKEEKDNNTYDRTIICSDFVTYDITKRIIEGTDIKVDGIDFSSIDWDKGISGRDRNKINKSMLFINGTWVDGEELGNFDKNLNRISIGDFSEKKENNKDNNKLYSGIKIDLSVGEMESTDKNTDNKQQVIVNPNANKGNKTNSDKDKNKTENNSETEKPEEINETSETSSNNEETASSVVLNNETEPKSDLFKWGLRLYFMDINKQAAPVGSDNKGYALGSFPVGYEITNGNNDNDKYHEWLCNILKDMCMTANYAIVDNGNGTYTIFKNNTALIPRFEVIGSVEDIVIPESLSISRVNCESSTKPMLGAYSDCFVNEGASAKAENKIVLANTVDYANGFWLDVKNTRAFAERLKDKLIEIDAENKDIYENNYKKVDSDLASLDDKFQFAVDSSKNHVLFIGGAFVYGYMVDSYGIDYVSIYDYSTQQETATPTRLMNYADILSQYKIKYIIKDKESTMDGINSVKAEINHNLNTLIIDTIDHVDKWDDYSYFDLMDDNCTILKKGLY